MLLPTNAILAALCPLQLLGWDAWPCPALLMGIVSFLACVTPFSMSVTPFLTSITSFPASVTCSCDTHSTAPVSPPPWLVSPPSQ